MKKELLGKIEQLQLKYLKSFKRCVDEKKKTAIWSGALYATYEIKDTIIKQLK